MDWFWKKVVYDQKLGHEVYKSAIFEIFEHLISKVRYRASHLDATQKWRYDKFFKSVRHARQNDVFDLFG